MRKLGFYIVRPYYKLASLVFISKPFALYNTLAYPITIGKYNCAMGSTPHRAISQILNAHKKFKIVMEERTGFVVGYRLLYLLLFYFFIMYLFNCFH